MSHKLFLRNLLILATAFIIGGCSNANNPAPNNSSIAQSTPVASPETGFEADLEYVKKGQYTYVWIFSRKDGKPLDKDDSAYLRKNAPQVVDWVRTDGGKKVFAGTNFNLEEGNLVLLRNRYVFEDYSNK